MNVSLHLSKLTFASGDTLSLEPDSIVLFVGPNSSGKTQSLKDLWNQITSPHRFRGLSIVDATPEKNRYDFPIPGFYSRKPPLPITIT